MQYFTELTTVAEIKAEYRRLAFELHPDHGGDTAKMQDLNNQYEAALKRCNGQTSTDDSGQSHTYKWDEAVERKVMEVIDKLIKLNMTGVDVLLIGTWLWVLGDTKPHKDALKEMGCKWHSKRGCWYYNPYEGRYYSSGKDLGTLAAQYGYAKVNLDKKEEDKKSSKKRLKTA